MNFVYISQEFKSKMMLKKDFLERAGISENQFNGSESVGGYLDLGGLTSIPEGFNPTVGGYLDLGGLTSIPEGFNPTVGDSLYLGGLTSIPEGFNPTVGDSLYLGGLTSIPEGFNPTVGDSLYLGGLTRIPEGFNPTVGGYLDLGGLTSNYTKLDSTNGLTWQNGKYILADGILSEVLHQKGSVYKVKVVGKKEESYLVSSDGNWSHGSTLKEAREDLIYKVSNRDKSEYEGLEKTHVFTFEESIKCYRVVTGACAKGVKSFIESKGLSRKKRTISEIAEITKGAYGHSSFVQFFNI